MADIRIVLNAEPLHYSPVAMQHWESAGYMYKTLETLSPSEYSYVEVIIVRIARFVGTDFLKPYTNIKGIISATTGWDHLDIAHFQERNIRLCSLREHKEFLKTIPSTAEHTWALLMALVRKVPQANQHVKNGQWNRDMFRGMQLKGKKLGILGMGRTGRKVATYGQAFQMKIIYMDPYVTDAEFQKVDNLHLLMQESDILTIHVHLNNETKGIINAEALDAANPGLFMINTSRGGVWHEDAVAETLRSGRLGGIATDVLESELENTQGNPIVQALHDGLNVVITPHIGGATWEAMWDCEVFLANYYCTTYTTERK